MKFYLFVFIALLGVSSCTDTTEKGSDSSGDPTTATSPEAAAPTDGADTAGKVNAAPKDALEAFVNAVKAKDETAIKAALSEKTNKMFELKTKMDGKGILDAFDAKEFEAFSKAPEVRNEKIEGDKASLETKDPTEDKWDEMKFVRENGSWKIAMLDSEYDKDYENMVKAAEKMSKEKSGDSDKKKESEEKGESKGAGSGN